MPSEVPVRTCDVSARKEDQKLEFQRSLDVKRAQAIAEYIDLENGTIPNSIVLSAQKEANLKIVGKGKALELSDVENAFLILDGQQEYIDFRLRKSLCLFP